MKKTTRLIGLSLLVATCAVALAAWDPVSLKFTPKVGDTIKYHLTADVDTQMGSASVTADIQDKITKSDGDGYTTESAQTNGMVSFNGGSQPIPDGTDTTVTKANGEIVDITTDQGEQPGMWRVAELDNFIYPDKPVSVGDEWSHTVAADDKKGIVAASAQYKVDSMEKIGDHDTAKVKVTYKETAGDSPASSDGYVWVDVKDGSIVKKETTWTNVPLGPMPVNGKVKLERVD
jgi:hypothetical protein